MMNREPMTELMKKLDPSKIEPLEYKILVKYKKPPKKTEGGIYITEMSRQFTLSAEIFAQIIRIGDLAFTNDDGSSWDKKPKENDYVILDKYNGMDVYEDDEWLYKLVNDKEIGAIYKEKNE